MPPQPQVQKLKDITDVIWKWGYLAGIAMVFYFRSTFVSKEDFENIYKPMEKALIILIEQQKHTDVQDRNINSLEARVRALEMKHVAGDNYNNQAYPK
jgi:hypothetical protein